jgi:hypothetical protein
MLRRPRVRLLIGTLTKENWRVQDQLVTGMWNAPTDLAFAHAVSTVCCVLVLLLRLLLHAWSGRVEAAATWI